MVILDTSKSGLFCEKSLFFNRKNPYFADKIKYLKIVLPHFMLGNISESHPNPFRRK